RMGSPGGAVPRLRGHSFGLGRQVPSLPAGGDRAGAHALLHRLVSGLARPFGFCRHRQTASIGWIIMFDFLTTHQHTVLQSLGLIVVGAPTLLVVVLGISSLVGQPLPERITGRSVAATVVSGLLASLLILGYMLISGAREVPIQLGDWVEV